KLIAMLERGLAQQALAARLAEVEARLDERFGIERLVGRSRAMVRVVEQVRHIAPTRAAVLVEGEPGTGKALVAQAIHGNSTRAGERFVWVDCGALAGANEVERELFGEERDLPGNPHAVHRGRVELADGGTLFLDEVGDAPAAAQLKLLRVIQERAYERLGG